MVKYVNLKIAGKNEFHVLSTAKTLFWRSAKPPGLARFFLPFHNESIPVCRRTMAARGDDKQDEDAAELKFPKGK